MATTSKGKKRRRRQSEDAVPLHRPRRILAHLADEYAEAGNVRVAAELRRHLLGHAGRFVEVAMFDKDMSR